MRLGRPRRLHTRIYLSTLVVLVVVVVAVGALFSRAARPALLHGPAERMARRVAERVSARLHDPAARAALVRELAEDFAVDVTVRDADGRLLAAAGQELPPLGPRDQAALRRGPIIVHLRGHRGWFAAAPLLDPRSGTLRGVLEVSLLQRAPLPSLVRPVALTAVVLLLVAVLTLPLARRISRPVAQLTEANRRFGAGELGYRIPERCEHRDDELEQLLRSWNEMAARIEALVRSQKELLANVSHELRSPLSRIRVALALLPEDAAVQARLADVEADIGELERLIDDVLTTSRLEAAGLPLRADEVAARPLLQAVADRAPAGGVQVAPGPEITLRADGALLRRALWNLVENALKYGAPPVIVGAALEGDAVVFSVSDEGPGVPATERERVLEPFYRADRARTPGGGPGGHLGAGFGLGLTLARRIAELHGGVIALAPARLERGREVGLRVTLRVPVRPSSPATPGR